MNVLLLIKDLFCLRRRLAAFNFVEYRLHSAEPEQAQIFSDNYNITLSVLASITRR